MSSDNGKRLVTENFCDKISCSIRTQIRGHRHAKRARVIYCDRSIRRSVCSNDLVKLIICCNVQQERNWEFMMYVPCYIGNCKIAK